MSDSTEPRMATIAQINDATAAVFGPALLGAADYLDELANVMDRWAVQSESGGWSTHQVKANRGAANDCRRKAAQLRETARKGRE